jgi:hypothetical protein
MLGITQKIIVAILSHEVKTDSNRLTLGIENTV